MLFLKSFLSSVRRWESTLSVKEWQVSLNQTQYLTNHSCLGPLMWVPELLLFQKALQCVNRLCECNHLNLFFVYKLHIMKKMSRVCFVCYVLEDQCHCHFERNIFCKMFLGFIKLHWLRFAAKNLWSILWSSSKFAWVSWRQQKYVMVWSKLFWFQVPEIQMEPGYTIRKIYWKANFLTSGRTEVQLCFRDKWTKQSVFPGSPSLHHLSFYSLWPPQCHPLTISHFSMFVQWRVLHWSI